MSGALRRLTAKLVRIAEMVPQGAATNAAGRAGLASHVESSWNQIADWLRMIDQLRAEFNGEPLGPDVR